MGCSVMCGNTDEYTSTDTAYTALSAQEDNDSAARGSCRPKDISLLPGGGPLPSSLPLGFIMTYRHISNTANGSISLPGVRKGEVSIVCGSNSNGGRSETVASRLVSHALPDDILDLRLPAPF